MRPMLTSTILALAAAAPHALPPVATGAGAPTATRTATATPAQEAWLGVSIGSAEGGVAVTSVREGSPAQRAGLQGGDLLLEFDGHELGAPAELVDLVRSHAAGEAVHVRFAREGREFERVVTLGARGAASTEGLVRARSTPEPAAPAPAPDPPSMRRATAHDGGEDRGWLGVTLGLEDGVVAIRGVLDDSPAAVGGLRAGDRVLALNGTELTDLAGLVRLVGAQLPGDRVQLSLSREGRELELLLTLGERPAEVRRPTPAPSASPSLPGARGNWQTALDRMLRRELELRRDEREGERRFGREAARHFRQLWREPAEDLLGLLREHDGEALDELREIAEQFREERLEAFEEFHEHLGELEHERREQLVEWRERIAERSREARPSRAPRTPGAADPDELESLRREIEELRERLGELRHEGGSR